MEQFEHEKSNQRPQDQRYHHKTNEFYHRASEAMELPHEAGKKVAQCILRNIMKRIHPNEARQLNSELPMDLKEECSNFIKGPDKSINAEKFKESIIKAAQIDNIDPQEVAQNFYSFLANWMHDNESEHRGETSDVLDNLPKDVKALFGHPVQ
ncbi:MAG: DUF2267 domain-containing protein [Bacteriovoracaceae bacterium]|nr:DUF2267 domain-containing protein [Bacteriovoracaceae bacterium]